MWTVKSVLLLAGSVRLLLICYGRVQDALLEVKFTDIDYSVYSDAARLAYAGDSPYARATYRYTPWLAYLLIPNVFYPQFGKVLFNVCDLLVGYLIYWMCRRQIPPVLRKLEGGRRWSEHDVNKLALESAALWLFNPLTAVVSSRGNADVIVCAAVLLTLALLEAEQWVLAAVIHGMLAIQLKIYPLIYLPSIFLRFIWLKHRSQPTFSLKYFGLVLFNWKGYAYSLICLGSFAALTYVTYQIFGLDFLDESLLYHLRRVDIKHNFSPYFYLLYLSQDDLWWLKAIGFGAFLPQLLVILYFSYRFSNELPFCWFGSTLAFVTFNKVVTSQYFLWYLSLLPLCYPMFALKAGRHHLRLMDGFRPTLLWFSGQAVWLFFAYLLEFRGYQVFFPLFLASVAFLLINCYILRRVVSNFVEFSPFKAKTE